MRRFALSVAFAILFSAVASPQGTLTQTQQSTTPPAATKDPQAVSVLNQALTVGGGIATIKSVSDYTATGVITYHAGNGNDPQGSVTVLGGASGQVRIDANLSTGVRSWGVVDGLVTTKAENGTLWNAPQKSAKPSVGAIPYRTPPFASSMALPLRELVSVLNSPTFNLIYKGLSQLDGHSVYGIRAQRTWASQANPNSPIAQSGSIDFFIDSSNSQLIMTQDLQAKGTVHQLRYSNYGPANGILVPFSIEERLGAQPIWTIQLKQFVFDTGLQDSVFTIQ